DVVRGRYLAIVGTRVARTKRLRRFIRRVRFVNVEEEKKRLRIVLVFADRLLRQRARGLAAALRASDAEEGRIDIDVVFPEIETAFDAGLAAQHDRGNRPAGGVAFRLQQLRERSRPRIEVVAKVVADAMVRGEKSGENAGVRDKRERAMRISVLEKNGVGVETIDGWRRDLGVAVG